MGKIPYHDWQSRYTLALHIVLGSAHSLTTAEIAARLDRSILWTAGMLRHHERRGFVARLAWWPGRPSLWVAVPTPAWVRSA